MPEREGGGLNLLNLKNYYWAAQLKAIIMWITKETDAVWVGMEQRSCQHAPLESLPFLNETTWKKLKIGNDWIRVTMKIWSLVGKKFKLSSSICRATKITRNPDFLPSMMDTGYNKWTNTGLIFIAQVFDGQTMKSFEQLRRDFNLPAQDFYKFLQLRHYLQKHTEWENICNKPFKLEERLMSFTEETKKGVISKMYEAIQHESNDNSMDVKERWELETNIIITDEQWEETFKAGHKLTNSPSWWEFDWKVKMRFFNTPSVTSKYSNTSDLCWRGCGSVGDFTHIFWDCPKLLDCWKNVQKETKQISGMNVALDPELYILGILPDNMTDRDLISLLRTLLLIAK